LPELRQDPLTGQWVSLAPGRASRPEVMSYPQVGSAEPDADCPFCEGHEHLTPPEVAALRAEGPPDGPGWSVRAVPNLFPAFSTEDAPADLGNPMRARGPALGFSEVIIHSPDHRRWLPYLSAAQADTVMRFTRQRYRAHSVPGAGTVVPFYNHGKDAGASLPHPHGQLMSMRLAAPQLDTELGGAEEGYRRLGACVICRVMEDVLADDARLVAHDEQFVAVTPWASRTPYEVWIVPREHEADFGRITPEMAGEFGVFLRATLWRHGQVLADVPLNWYVHSLAHAAGESTESYHWHLEIRPKLANLAGFELATGTYINTVAPEDAAEILRQQAPPGTDEAPPPRPMR